MKSAVRLSASLLGLLLFSGCAVQEGSDSFVLTQDAPILSSQTAELDSGVAAFKPSDVGAIVFFNGALRNEDGVMVGEIMGVLTSMEIAQDALPEYDRMRELIFNLEGGQIFALGASSYRGIDEIPDFPGVNTPVEAAVVGGTGKYIGALGTVTTTLLDDKTYTHEFILLG